MYYFNSSQTCRDVRSPHCAVWSLLEAIFLVNVFGVPDGKDL